MHVPRPGGYVPGCVSTFSHRLISVEMMLADSPEDQQACRKGLPGDVGAPGVVRPHPARAVLLGTGQAPESELLKGT